jgi:hypothetical protein
MGIKDGWKRLTGHITATAKGLTAKLRPQPAAMIGVPPSARQVSADPAWHALDFAQRYADPMDYLVSQRMLELGIHPDHIRSSDLTHGIRHAAFNPFERTGGGNGPGGRLTVDSGIFNTDLHSDLGKEVSSAWAKSRLRDRMDAIIAHEYSGFLGASHAEAEARAADTDLPITTRARRLLRVIGGRSR